MSNLGIKEKIKKAPLSPGVYFWLDKKGNVLYVGRASRLRSRLSQYLSGRIEPRIKEMVELADKVDYQPTANLLEAVILEAQKIKEHWPKYNVVDRDDRSFIYIVIPKGDYPRPLIVRGHDLAKFSLSSANIFGPYQSFRLVQSALRLIRPIFPYSTCKAKSGRPCFDYQIGLCPGTCLGLISALQYGKNIRNIRLLLSGQKERLIEKLKKENPEKIKALAHIQDVSLLTSESDLSQAKVSRIEGYDISHFAGRESYGAMVVFSNGEEDRRAYRLFKIKEAKAGDDEGALLEVISRRLAHPEWPRPDLIMIDGGRPQISYLAKKLSALNFDIPLVGISKYGGDSLVFNVGVKKSFRELTESIKPILLKIREEAHRFANYGRKRAVKSNFKKQKPADK